MKSNLFFLLFLIFQGCAQQNQESKNLKSDTEIPVYLQTEAFKSKQTKTQAKITEKFIELAHYAESCGYICDTNRLKKLGSYIELDKSKMISVSGKFFYAVDINKHEVFHVKAAIARDLVNKSESEVDYDIFTEAKSIYGYYYRKKTESAMIEDGMIEEWTFATESEARKAMTEIKKIGFELYFNTEPFFFQTDKYFYIFHTRAAGFNETLKKFHTKFREMCLKNQN